LLVDARGNTAGDDPGQVRWKRRPERSLAASLVDVWDEDVNRGEVPPMGSRTGRDNLDQRKAGALRPVGDRRQERSESTADALWPGAGPLVCGGGIVGQPFEQPVMCCKEAALLVAEVLVEGATAHPGAACYLDDCGWVVALFRNRVDHRFEHPLVL